MSDLGDIALVGDLNRCTSPRRLCSGQCSCFPLLQKGNVVNAEIYRRSGLVLAGEQGILCDPGLDVAVLADRDLLGVWMGFCSFFARDSVSAGRF